MLLALGALALSSCNVIGAPTGNDGGGNTPPSSGGGGGTTPGGDGGSTPGGNNIPEIEKETPIYEDISVNYSLKPYDPIDNFTLFYNPGNLTDPAYQDNFQNGFLDARGYLTPINSGFYESVNEGDAKLVAPGSTVNNKDELQYLLDYCAFYKVSGINFTYAGPSSDIYLGWWNSPIMPASVGMSVSGSNPDYHIDFLFNDNAATLMNTVALEEAKNDIAIKPYDVYGKGGLVKSLPYTPTKGNLNVNNTDQLLYAVLNGYNPIVKENSIVELTYKRALHIIASYVRTGMNETDKIFVLDNWLLNNAIYDGALEEASYTSNNKYSNNVYPDFVGSHGVGSFAEGPILFGQGICHGNAKAEALLLALAGVNVRKVAASQLGNDIQNTINGVLEDGNLYDYNYHGYNYVKIGDKYYITDPTYSTSVGNTLGPDYVFTNYSYAIASGHDEWYNYPYANFLDPFYLQNPTLVSGANLEYDSSTYISTNRVLRISDGNDLLDLSSKMNDIVDKYKARHDIPNGRYYQFTVVNQSNTFTKAEYQSIFAKLEEACNVYDGYYYYNLSYDDYRLDGDHLPGYMSWLGIRLFIKR